MFSKLDTDALQLLNIVVIAFGAFLAILFAQWFINFRKQLRDINNEIKRTYGREKERWIDKKRKLLLSIIPFVKYR